MEQPKLFNEGDKVRRKEGGPVMLVKAAPDHMAYCTWEEGGKATQGTFHQEALEFAEGDAVDS